MRADIPCFTGTTISHHIATSCCILDNCSTLCCLNPKNLYSFCILIGLKHPSEIFPNHPYPESTVEKSSCGPEIAIVVPGPSSEYTEWPNIVDDLGLMNLSIIVPSVFPLALSTMVANDVCMLSTSNTSGGVYLSTFSLLFPGRTNFGDKLVPVSATIIPSWEFTLFCFHGGP